MNEQDTDTARKRLSRRQAISLMGATGLALVIGCGDDDGATEPSAADGETGAEETAMASSSLGPTAVSTPTAEPVVNCVITPALTEGPYFVDERLNRSDIRPDPTTGVVSAGAPLLLALTVSSVAGSGCTPLAGAVIDMWHCDALGVYSDVSGGAGQQDTTGEKFLRGFQVTDQDGKVAFQTIYPGWYSGRTIHIHYKVRTDPDSSRGLEFTSQLFFEESVNDEVTTTRSPYSAKGMPDQRNATDSIFDPALIVPLTATPDGYVGTFHVGVATA
jgi:protocatechuate 3,4-dioxygenase beta subunit